MSSLMGSHGVAIATAMAAVSGTVILIAVCRQKPLSASSTATNLRSCICSDERKRGQRRSKKKKVRFAKDVAREFDEETNYLADQLEVEEHEVTEASLRKIPANRVALYHGMLQDRSRRMACSH